MKVSLQKSKDEEDKKKETSARYATVWLDHGADPTDKKYEYVIAVNRDKTFIQVCNILRWGIAPPPTPLTPAVGVYGPLLGPIYLDPKIDSLFQTIKISQRF